MDKVRVVEILQSLRRTMQLLSKLANKALTLEHGDTHQL